MPQLVLLLKRKPGMTKEEFKAHYESSHAAAAVRWQGRLMQDYRRNYTQTQFGLDAFAEPQGDDTAYDAVTVISFESDEQMQAFLKEGAEHAEWFLADEHRFLDRSKVLGFIATQEVSKVGAEAG